MNAQTILREFIKEYYTDFDGNSEAYRAYLNDMEDRMDEMNDKFSEESPKPFNIGSVMAKRLLLAVVEVIR